MANGPINSHLGFEQQLLLHIDRFQIGNGHKRGRALSVVEGRTSLDFGVQKRGN